MKNNNRGGAALIIVIFATMLFAILGWTLANLQSGDFEANLRNLDSGQALSLAEAGSQWALSQLSQDTCWRTLSGAGGSYCGSVDSVCSSSDWLSSPHNLGPGQYNVCCRNPVSGTETGDAVIEAKGYMPGQNNYRAMRQIKLSVTLGSFNKVLQAKNIFDWTQAAAFSVSMDGDVEALRYNADGDVNYNEIGIDYSNAAPLLPPDGSGDSRTIGNSLYPVIDMAYFEAETNPSRVWDNAKNETALSSSNSNELRVNTRDFFTGMVNEAVRSKQHGWNDTPPYGWAKINSVQNNGRTAILDRTIGNDWDGDDIQIVKLFDGNINNQNLWYIKGDVVLDARSGNVRFQRTGLVAEGDIVLKGANTVDFSDRPQEYPSLATKDGDIVSLDTPDGGNDSAKRNRRTFDGLIYSENGDVNFNYIRGTALMGNNITLMGSIDLEYESDLLEITGFISSGSQIVWQEQ